MHQITVVQHTAPLAAWLEPDCSVVISCTRSRWCNVPLSHRAKAPTLAGCCHIMHQITVVQLVELHDVQGRTWAALSYHAPDHGGATL